MDVVGQAFGGVHLEHARVEVLVVVQVQIGHVPLLADLCGDVEIFAHIRQPPDLRRGKLKVGDVADHRVSAAGFCELKERLQPAGEGRSVEGAVKARGHRPDCGAVPGVVYAAVQDDEVVVRPREACKLLIDGVAAAAVGDRSARFGRVQAGHAVALQDSARPADRARIDRVVPLALRLADGVAYEQHLLSEKRTAFRRAGRAGKQGQQQNGGDCKSRDARFFHPRRLRWLILFLF